MLVLMLVAAARAADEFAIDRPLTWVMLVGFVTTALGSAYLWFYQRPRTEHRPANTE